MKAFPNPDIFCYSGPSIEVETVFPVTCETRANFMVDDTFTVICPAGCDAEESNIWGTGVYTDDSYVCGAAIHDGRLPGKKKRSKVLKDF